MSDEQYVGKIVAVTGHRPDKLGGYGEAVFNDLVKLAEHCLTRLKPKLVITGMALGWDLAIAEACLNLGVPFKAYIPGEWQPDAWVNQYWVEVWRHHCHYAIEVVDCDPYPETGYAGWKLQKRNERMVDDCEILLALYNGGSGGTGNCYNYARKRNVQILNVWQRWQNKDF